MSLSVNMTVAVPPEMVQSLNDEAEKRGMSRAEYVRHLIREADSSPFDSPTDELPNPKNSQTETGAA